MAFPSSARGTQAKRGVRGAVPSAAFSQDRDHDFAAPIAHLELSVGPSIWAGRIARGSLLRPAPHDMLSAARSSAATMPSDPSRAARPAVAIEYCRQCRWLLRAAWMAQELLSTFEEEIGGVTLVPGTGGVFVVRLGGDVVWSRKDEGRFPEIAELKQRVRDRVAPERDLGHVDRKNR
jgi:selenoprotein W-related protein